MFVKNLSKIAVVAACAGFVSVSAQNATAQDVNVVTANFQQAGLIPSFLPSLSPQGVLEVAFNGTQINIGEPQTQDAVGAFPNIQINPLTGSSAWGFGNNFTYTALMADADIVGTSGSTPQTFHWLANGLTLGSSSVDPPFSLNLTTATTIINYAGPGPFAGSGAHRYVIMLVRQYSNFTAPSGLNSPNTPLGTHSTSQYLSTTGLGSIVAASYFTVENGQATVTVSSTSAVDVATVATVLSTSAASSMGSASMTGSRSGSASSVASTGSRTGAATGAASSAAASSGAAMTGKAIGGNWVVAGVTVVGVFFGALMI